MESSYNDFDIAGFAKTANRCRLLKILAVDFQDSESASTIHLSIDRYFLAPSFARYFPKFWLNSF
ncbi:MAG: hypothetical protein MUE44_35290 [Oscillatoriaceae cyanobacterium Prado104]|nr:hypothetical protein [Oscillatoriaceae cyanobacterium Prado104]